MSTSATLRKAFVPIHAAGDLPAAVRLARRAAKTVLLKDGLDDDVVSITEHLAGEVERTADGSVDWERFTHQLYAAFVMGLALGQLVSADVFNEGAR